MKVLIFKKTTLFVTIVVSIFLIVFSINNTILPVGASLKMERRLPIYEVETDENKLSISFDAAWGADKTSEIMDVCDAYGVKATFFLVGFWIEKYPEKVKEIYNRGFEIGIHSSTHPDMTKLSRQEIRNELSENMKLVEELTGFVPKLFRPPYGYYNNVLIEECDNLGLSCIEWSVDSLDWKGLSATEIASRVTSRAKNGSIILCHNNSDHIINSIKLIFEYFKLKKMKLVPIGELIYYDDFRINSLGVQVKK